MHIHKIFTVKHLKSLLAVQEFNVLVYSEPGGIDCSLLVLWFLSVNLDVDVIRF